MIKLGNFCKVLTSCCFVLLQVSGTLSHRQKRVVGGDRIHISTAPFLVQLLSDGGHICGGALISENYVITAAHCVEDRAAARLGIVGGTTKLSELGVRSDVSSVMVPTTYNSKTADTDIAVIKLKTPMKGHKSVKPVRLCSSSWREGHPVQIYGWGLNSQNDTVYPDEVHAVKVNVVNNDICQKKYPLRKLTKSMFCAGGPERDACLGDSGGPAIINGQLCGIISWGNGCGGGDSAGVYTNIKYMNEFIQSAMKH